MGGRRVGRAPGWEGARLGGREVGRAPSQTRESGREDGSSRREDGSSWKSYWSVWGGALVPAANVSARKAVHLPY